MSRLLSAVQVLGLLLLGGYFLAQLDTSGLHALATPRAALWLVAALFAYCVGQLLNGIAWRHLLNNAGGDVSIREMLLHDLSSVFWCTVLPGGVVGELVKGVRLARSADPGAVAVSIVTARLIGGTVACLLALVSLPFSGFDGLYQAVGGAALLATVCVGFGGLIVLKIGPAALPAFVARRVPIGVFPAWRHVVTAFGLAIVTHTAFALVFCACFAAVGQWIPFPAGAVVSALTSVAQTVPITVGGMGIRELTIAGLGAAVVPHATADAAAIALAGVFTVFVLLGGLVELGRMARTSR
jgi:uncharacterized membrane protein YbhN (UPF0104 family)